MSVRRMIDVMDALSLWAPRLLMLVLFILPLAIGFRGGLANAVVVGIVMAVVTDIVQRLVDGFVIAPLRSVRFARGASQLETALRTAAPPCVLVHRWSSPYPGVLAVTTQSRLLLIDRSTGYDLVQLDGDGIVEASVNRALTLETRTRQGMRLGLGAGGSLFGFVSFGGRSRSATQAIETAVLELRYCLRRPGTIHTAVIGFGRARTGGGQPARRADGSVAFNRRPFLNSPQRTGVRPAPVQSGIADEIGFRT